MTINRMLALLVLLIVPSSFFVDASLLTGNTPSFVNGPNSWRNTPSSDFSFWESAGVKPILVNGMFVCGFNCSFSGDNCLFSVSIFNSSSVDGDSSFSGQVVWSANRNNPVEVQAVLELTSQGKLILKDANDTVVWSPSTANKPISGLNLSAEGNLILFDKTNHMVWQSFDHPTDTIVVGQMLSSGQKLRASVSPDDPSEGLYAFAVIDGEFTAYMDSDPSQIYYIRYLIEQSNTVLFQTGRFGSFSVADSASFIQLGSDGHLKAYEWKDSIGMWQGTDLLKLDRCEYPLACGNYSVCLEDGCRCLDYASENETKYFMPVDYRIPGLGCSAISPIFCDHPLQHSFLHLQANGYQQKYGFFSFEQTLQDCQEACLNNCSCKAAVYSSGYCSFLSQVFTIKRSEEVYDNISVFIKVRNSSISESPNANNISSPNFTNNISSPNFTPRKSQNTRVIVGSILGAVFFVFLICILVFLRSRKGFQEVEEDYLDNVLGTPVRFSYEDLKNVTKNFSNKLGEGGFGSVFHGVLPSASEVAVKNLAGFGFLVYEYMANGSLDGWIFNKNQETALGWQIRKKIILDIAKGLAYLHEGCNQKIIHLDIKPQNILLDENFNAKVSDFGLSKILGKEQSRVITTMRGTPGYMAPEWRKKIGICWDSFRTKQEEEKLMDLVDKCSDDMQSNAAEVVEMMKVAAWCLQTEYARRPSMSTVVKLFEGSVDVEGNMNEEFLNGLTPEAMEAYSSTILPSMLSGPR
ncbi:Signal peptide peptidase isoform 1 [Hibiscus syriacus]|uniref:Receptor-like serine/threonine-protein kinase n=1 Tax=Hibiscus syriacus TaxID=106335 RepID=A0A6A2ZBG2_HIBSY|nr:Signal peptide peptidase isoform 1 [Hibiscus syriacus]